jgi:hypothetical protein
MNGAEEQAPRARRKLHGGSLPGAASIVAAQDDALQQVVGCGARDVDAIGIGRRDLERLCPHVVGKIGEHIPVPAVVDRLRHEAVEARATGVSGIDDRRQQRKHAAGLAGIQGQVHAALASQRAHRALERAAVVSADEHAAAAQRDHDDGAVSRHDNGRIDVAAVAFDLLLAHPRPARPTVPSERQAEGETQK